MKKFIFVVLIIGLIMVLCHTVEAAVNFAVSKTSGATDVTMNDPAGTSVTYTITASNNSDPIVKLVFRLPNANISTGSFTWTGASSLPAGWSVTAGTGTRQITVEGPAINAGSSASFSFTLGAIPTWSADVTDQLDRIIATSSQNAKKTLRNLPLFTRHALRLSMVANPSTVAPGTGFVLILTVKNESSALLNSIRSDLNPPAMTVLSGAISAATRNQSPAPNPNPLSLAAGTTGTITYNYATAGGDNGSINFSARVRYPSAGGVTASSLTAVSNTVVIGGFVGTINSTVCVYDGNTITVTMTLNNFTASAINNVVRTLFSAGTTTSRTLIGGANPAPSVNIPAGGAAAYTWTYRINGALNQTYSFTGTAVGSSTAVVAGWNGGRVGGYSVTVTPASTNASSTNVGLTWSFVNNGCANAQSVSIAVPAGWTFGGDGYAKVINTVPDEVETWGAGPLFSAPNATDQMPYGESGDFNLIFSSTPATAGPNTFDVHITDVSAIEKIVPTTVTVIPFDSGAGGGNYTRTGVWQEVVR